MSTIEQIPQLPVSTEKNWQQYLIDSLLAVGGASVAAGPTASQVVPTTWPRETPPTTPVTEPKSSQA